MTELWNQVASDATLLMAANVLLQVTLLTGLGLIVACSFRHNATVRHCVLLSVAYTKVRDFHRKGEGCHELAPKHVGSDPDNSLQAPAARCRLLVRYGADHELVRFADGQERALRVWLSSFALRDRWFPDGLHSAGGKRDRTQAPWEVLHELGDLARFKAALRPGVER